MGKVVGIVSKHAFANSWTNGRALTIVNDEVKQAVIDAGLVPIGILPPKWEICLNQNIKHNESHLTEEELEVLEWQLSICDGIILPGGGNSDDFEYDVARYAYENDVPILGICHGQGVMVQILGGKITKVDEEKHKQPDIEYVHGCRVVGGTKFCQFVGTHCLMVNSRHKYAVSDPGPDLMVSAIDEDGNIEVIEARDKSFYVGVRFHPESLYKKDLRMASIFRNFAQVVEERP